MTLKFCEWSATAGRLCQVPVGTVSASNKGRLVRDRYCAYHRHRAGRSLQGQFTTERQAFDAWLATVEGRGPFPHVWHEDREQLWRLLDGQVTWPEYCAAWRQAQVSA